MFNLEPNNRKCLKEEIHKGVLVTGDYDISSHPGQVVDLMVIDTKGQHFVNYENTEKGKFAFTTDDYDVYEICFLSRVPGGMRAMRHEVFLQTKTMKYLALFFIISILLVMDKNKVVATSGKQ